MVQGKRKSRRNDQYSRRECLEIVGIPESVTNNSLEETALNICKEFGASIGTSNIEAYHHVGSSNQKKVIVKMSRQKDADRVRRIKKS